MSLLLAALALAPSHLVLNLAPDNSTIHLGENFMGQLRYTNSGRTPVTVLPMNASEHRIHKAPRGHIEVRRVGQDKWGGLTGPPGCGNTNPIQVSDFQVLQAGESALRQAWFPWKEGVVGKSNMEPGQYEVRFVYDTSEPIDNWIGGPVPEPLHSRRRADIQALFDGTPHGVFVSGPVRLTVR